MVGDLIVCPQAYKGKMEFQGLDFDGDRAAQYKELRKEMAKMHEERTFEVVEIGIAPKPIGKLSNEKETFVKQNKTDVEGVGKGLQF